MYICKILKNFIYKIKLVDKIRIRFTYLIILIIKKNPFGDVTNFYFDVYIFLFVFYFCYLCKFIYKKGSFKSNRKPFLICNSLLTMERKDYSNWSNFWHGVTHWSNWKDNIANPNNVAERKKREDKRRNDVIEKNPKQY